jgi:S-adenosylmethionine:tRNA ribosyltransferase-isomerase
LWTIIGQTRGKIQPGERITLPARQQKNETPPLFLTLIEKSEAGQWLAEPSLPGGALTLLGSYGTVPLPPYIKRQLPDDEDFQRYQTTYAKHPGAVAAPTAGLHFSEELLAACQNRGVQLAYVTLHVGIGTFRPISTDTFSEHVMHTEWCEMNQATADILNSTRNSQGRIVPVGTTSVRTLETVARNCNGEFQAWRGETNLFIYPPYQFQAVDGLVTNFHPPRSILLVLVSALGGRSRVLKAYQEAIEQKYRFFSYGDAMFIH